MPKKYFHDFARKKKDQLSDPQLFVLLSALKNHDQKGRFRQHLLEELKDMDVINLDFKKEIEEMIKENEIEKGEDQQRPRFVIESLQVSNFKGFGPKTNEHKGTRINFNDKKTIFFAPNGGGKTSLCNALEYELTGQIKEARRRGLSLKEYAYSNRSKDIKLSFRNKSFNTRDLTDYQKRLLENAFIEHNRISAFALLGSRDSGDDYRDVISTILGLEDLKQFMSYFIQPSSMKLNEKKVFKVSESFKNDEDEINRIRNTIDALKDTIKREKLDIKDTFSFEDRLTRRQMNKKIKELEEEIDRIDEEIRKIPVEKPVKINAEEIKDKINEIQNDLEEYEELGTELAEDLGNLNLNKFYESILQLNNQEYDHCPACLTKLSDVRVNPFEYAKDSLEKLSMLRKKSNRRETLKDKLEIQSFNDIEQLMIKYNDTINLDSSLRIQRLSSLFESLREIKQSKKDRIDYLKSVVKYFQDNTRELCFFYEKYKNIVHKYDKQKELKYSLEKKKEELENKKISLSNKLDSWGSLLEDVREKYKNLVQEKKKIKSLKKEKEKEESFNKFIDQIEEEYEMLYKQLTAYKNEIESEQIAGTENRITQYYQKMNIKDEEQEMVEEIYFTLKKDKYTVEIKVKGEKHNAFSKLSEGHLRTLGLSILLAVAHKNDLPVLIFDDIVNAIDAEHRANIIELMYEDTYLKNTQLIITTHDRLFWERFCNKASGIISSSKSEMSHIMNYTNRGIIIKQYNVKFYDKILEALNHFDIRQALVYCRIWFETIILEYCQYKKIDIKGNIRDNSLYLNMTPVLEDAYAQVSKCINNHEHSDQLKKHFNKIKNDFINWSGQNEGHHAFSEASYNFVHAKTSNEITDIYQAILNLQLILLPNKQNEFKKYYAKVKSEKNNIRVHLSGRQNVDNKTKKEIKWEEQEKERLSHLENKLKPLEKGRKLIDELEASKV